MILWKYVTNHIISTQKKGTRFEEATRAEAKSALAKFTKEKILRKT